MVKWNVDCFEISVLLFDMPTLRLTYSAKEMLFSPNEGHSSSVREHGLSVEFSITLICVLECDLNSPLQNHHRPPLEPCTP